LNSKNNGSPLGLPASTTTLTDFIDHIITHKDFFLFWKDMDWRDELEYKMVILNSTQLDQKMYLPIGDSLSAIFMGERFSLDPENKVYKDFCEKYDVSAFRIVYNGGMSFARPFNMNVFNP
jgi:hypothetical protein